LQLLPKTEGFERVLLAVNGPNLVGLAISGVIVTLLIAGFFRIGVRRDVLVRRVWYGTSTTVTIAAVASYLFAVYARTIARFAFYYGSLAAVAVLLAWLWLCSFALLLGAEVNSYLEEHPELWRWSLLTKGNKQKR
jgi:membrane protein